MKKNTLITYCMLAAIVLAGCKKDGTPGSGIKTPITKGNFFANTEWVGTCHSISQQYDKPCCIRFRGDTAVTVHALFTFFLAGDYQTPDTLRGTITKVDSLADGTITLALSFPFTGDTQTWYLKDKNKITGIDPTNNNSFNPHVQLAPATITPVTGTTWAASKVTYYPDVNPIKFNTGSETFIRSTKTVTYTATGKLPYTNWLYGQDRSIVYFVGYDDSRDKYYAYFGVLTADGNSMWVDSRPVDQSKYGYGTARLPNYLYTSEPYGPNGATPSITKQ